VSETPVSPSAVVTPVAPRSPSRDLELSIVVVSLFRCPLYRDTDEKLWHQLLKHQAAVADYVDVLGLHVLVDEAEGYAFLRSQPDDGDRPEVPRLMARHALGFQVSLLLALLRKRLAEFDAASADPRLVLDRDEIVEMLRLFLRDSTNEVKLDKSIDNSIGKVVELGFLRKLRGDENRYEVRRILKAYVDGQWLADFGGQLDAYLTELGRNDRDGSSLGARSDGEPE
jgi:Domain of unknown function (DUF4194)